MKVSEGGQTENSSCLWRMTLEDKDVWEESEVNFQGNRQTVPTSRTQTYALIRSHQMEYLGVYWYINFILGKRAVNFYLFLLYSCYSVSCWLQFVLKAS